MLAMIARRLLSLIPVLLVVSFVVFMLIELVPGDAATTVAGGANATPERIAEVRERARPRPTRCSSATATGSATRCSSTSALAT